MLFLPTVLIADPLPRGVYAEQFRQAGIEFLDDVAKSRLETAIADCEGLIVRSATKVTASLLDKAPKLRVIERGGTGIDGIDVDAATSRGVLVENTPDANSRSVAQHTMAFIYALSRNLVPAHLKMRSGHWGKKEYVAEELSGKTLGIIGFGRIGRLVAERAKVEGMRVVVFDRYVSRDNIQNVGCVPLSFEALLKEADYLSLHVPYIDKPVDQDGTRHIIDSKALALVKHTAKIINTARGELIDEKALHEALSSGRLAAAALDVFEEEPYSGQLLSLDSVLATPHVAGQATEAQARVAEQVVKQTIAYLLRGEFSNPVNINPFSREIRPYLDLVERMAYIIRRLRDEPLTKVEVVYYGELPTNAISGLATAALVGLMRNQVEAINLVNAPLVARQRGVEFFETVSSQATGYSSLVSLNATFNGNSTTNIQGNFYEKKGPRIVSLHGMETSFEPAGNMLISIHDDVPGVLEYLTGTLSRNGINIAKSDLTREALGRKAMAIFNLDSPVPEDILAQLPNQSKRVYRVYQVTIPHRLSPTL